jgi:DNA adenine methylase
MLMMIPHPIPYQGSKRNLASVIVAYLPDNTACLIEPFAGSAALSLAAASAYKAQSFILNDLNAPLMSLWACLIQEPNHLAKYYEQLWQAQLGRERSFYDWVRQRFNVTYRPHYFLYLLARAVKASVRYNRNGEFNQSPDNRRKGRLPDTMRENILAASCLLEGKSRLFSTDYEAVLAIAKPEDVIYLDPPYQGVSSSRDPRYLSGFSHERFIRVLAKLNERHIAYLLSYDGRTGDKTYGIALPKSLGCQFIELDAGVSSQATLLGRRQKTIESLYLSPALVQRLGDKIAPQRQLKLFGETA